MYTVDGNDSVVELTDLPLSSAGAPLPSVVATEHQTYLVYYVQDTSADREGMSRPVGLSSEGERVAVVAFDRCRARMFGLPNDEAFNGHPLYARGLRPYGFFEIKNSSWLRAMERMNSVHPKHSPGLFSGYRHFVFAFHDSTFECMAHGYKHETRIGSTIDALKAITASLK